MTIKTADAIPYFQGVQKKKMYKTKSQQTRSENRPKMVFTVKLQTFLHHLQPEAWLKCSSDILGAGKDDGAWEELEESAYPMVLWGWILPHKKKKNKKSKQKNSKK